MIKGISGENGLKKFFIYGKIHCPRRSLESTRLFRYLVSNGLAPASKPQKADYIFIYTCGGFTLDEELSILTLEKALELKSKSAKVIVTGCLTLINPQKINSYKSITMISPNEIDKLDSLIHASIPYEKIPAVSVVEGIHDLYHGGYFDRIKRHIDSSDLLAVCQSFFRENVLHKPLSKFSNSATFKIVIAEGCVGDCSYCAIKIAMPKFQSFPIEQIMERFNEGLKSGFREFAMIGGDIGCYGFDRNTDLPSLLKKLFSVSGDYKLTLVDLNPRWLRRYSEVLLETLRLNREKLSRVIIPLQSGSNKILDRMNRRYDAQEVKKFLLDLHKSIPELKIETHIIVGFPGETESDFNDSLQLVRAVGFSDVAIYRYEDRPGTLAANFEDKVPYSTIEARVKIIEKEVKTNSVNLRGKQD